jgi:hypothetical protein
MQDNYQLMSQTVPASSSDMQAVCISVYAKRDTVSQSRQLLLKEIRKTREQSSRVRLPYSCGVAIGVLCAGQRLHKSQRSVVGLQAGEVAIGAAPA